MYEPGEKERAARARATRRVARSLYSSPANGAPHGVPLRLNNREPRWRAQRSVLGPESMRNSGGARYYEVTPGARDLSEMRHDVSERERAVISPQECGAPVRRGESVPDASGTWTCDPKCARSPIRLVKTNLNSIYSRVLARGVRPDQYWRSYKPITPEST